MRQTIKNLLAVGLVVALAVPASAQTRAGAAAGAAGQTAPRGQGPYGGANAVQPGAGAGAAQPNPTGQPVVPQNRTNTQGQGQGPYGGANSVLPQQPASPTGPTPTANVAGNVNQTGPYGGFNAVQPPGLVPVGSLTPSLAFPGAGVPVFGFQQNALNTGAFFGPGPVSGVASSLPTRATTVNPGAVNAATPQGTGVFGATGTANAAQPPGVQQAAPGGVNPPQTAGSVQGQGPYGGANAVLPQQPASPTGTGVPGATPTPGAATGSGPYGGFESVQPPGFTPSRPTLGGTPAGPITAPQQTAVNPVFNRFFTGLNASLTPAGPVVTPTP